jgi:hypothetical protein
MLILVKIIGIIIAAIGLAVLLSPKVMKQIIDFWKKGMKPYLAGIIRIAIGLVFLSAAKESRLPIVITVLGILVIIKGVLLFILGLERIRKILDWWDKQPALLMRFLGLLALGVGLLILYSV